MRCGDCVHLSGRGENASCTPIGRRAPTAAVPAGCGWAFPMHQLQAGLYGGKPERAAQADLFGQGATL